MKSVVALFVSALSLSISLVSSAHAESRLFNVPLSAGEFQSQSVSESSGRMVASSPLPATSLARLDAHQLVVVVRSVDGKVESYTVVPDPRIVRAEVFDRVSGEIRESRIVKRDAALGAVVDITERSAMLDVMAADGPAARLADLRLLTRVRVGKLAEAAIAENSNVSRTTLTSNGPSSDRMDIVVVGDGYTSEEMGKWHADAQKVVEALMSDPAFAKRASSFNVHRIDVVSRESGADEPDQGIFKDTALGMYFNCDGLDRLLCADPFLTEGVLSSVVSGDERDVVVAVANSTRYGGAGGAYATLSMAPESKELALHEIGHAAFRLADEYDYGTCLPGEPWEANVTTVTERGQIKWRKFIEEATPLPTPIRVFPVSTVGLFQGAKYCTSGIYRPTAISRMRVLGHPWYAVNEAAIDRRIFEFHNRCDNCLRQSGFLFSGQSDILHLKGGAIPVDSGEIYLELTHGESVDFDLALYQSVSGKWIEVDKSIHTSGVERIRYSAEPGLYQVRIKSYTGKGNYLLRYKLP